MIYSLYLPLMAALLLAGVGPFFARKLAPAAATRILGIISVVSAGASVGTLLLLVFGGLMKSVPFSELGTMRDQLLTARDSVPWFLGVASTLLLIIITVRIGGAIRRETKTLQELRALVAESGDGLIVIVDSRPFAYAVPIDRGTVIVSTGILTGLSNEERCALLAHERAHLTGHHHFYRTVALLAETINPLLRHVRQELHLQSERWADENAAQEGSRSVTARSLARSALAATRAPSGTMGYSTDHVRKRLAALAIEPRPSQWGAVTPLALMTLTGTAALLDAAHACWAIMATFYP